MQSLLSKAFFASVTLSGLSLMAMPQAQAATMATIPDFAGGAVLDSVVIPGYSALGADYSPTDNALYNVFDARISTNAGVNGIEDLFLTMQDTDANTAINIPGTYTVSYTVNARQGWAFENALLSLNISGVGTPGSTSTKMIYDTEGGTLLGSAGLNTLIEFDKQSSLFVVDTINLGSGETLFSYTNRFEAVPEPLTMLGASAAIAFGAAFKRKSKA